jgi:hypothetical protein
MRDIRRLSGRAEAGTDLRSKKLLAIGRAIRTGLPFVLLWLCISPKAAANEGRQNDAIQGLDSYFSDRRYAGL